MVMPRRVLLVFSLFTCNLLLAQSTPKASELVEKANDLLSHDRAKESEAVYEQALADDPQNETALYNVGMAYFIMGDYDKAAARWQKLKAVEPDDWRLRAKLIQAYQALGDNLKRDQERAELIELKKKVNSPELREAQEFCREQATIAGRKVMVFEQFEMKGARAVRYAFIVLGDDGKEDFHLSLGSYDTTNAIWAELNKDKASKGLRLFHLDGYYKWGHATYGMYVGEPTYDDIHSQVVAVLEGKLKPASSSTFTNNK